MAQYNKGKGKRIMDAHKTYRPDKKVVIVKGLFAGETGKMDEVSKDGKYIKLVGRGWYNKKLLRVVEI